MEKESLVGLAMGKNYSKIVDGIKMIKEAETRQMIDDRKASIATKMQKTNPSS